MIEMIEVKAPVSGWHKVSREQARRYISSRMNNMQAIPKAERADYINRNLLRGATVQELQEQGAYYE